MLNIVFMGTPDFAIPTLKAIKQSGNRLCAVVTQPDRPKGRGKKIQSPPVKMWAVENGVDVFQPLKVNDQQFIRTLENVAPDIIITAAFGQILSKKVLDIPTIGCINVHASLLPKYRGASPIQQVLLDGESETGVTIMYMDIGMDTGDIILQQQIPILEEDNAGSLHDKLAELGGQLIGKTIRLFEEGKPDRYPQDNEKATYCSKIDKSMGQINWNQEGREIRNLVRALTPWPGCYTFIGDQRLKIQEIKILEKHNKMDVVPGQVLLADDKSGFVIVCKDSLLRITRLQSDGTRPMGDLDFLRGHSIAIGTVLGV